MKVTFWLLDLNYEAKTERPEIRIWGISASGERILIIDRNLPSYFYAIVKEEIEPVKLVEEIRKGDFQSITKLEVVERKFFGKPVKAVKVYCSNPDSISEYAKELRKLEDAKDCLEDDIRHAMRYLIDDNIVPCGWHEVEATETDRIPNMKADKFYLAKATPKLVEKAEVPKLRILGLSTICYSREGSPKPERNPVVIISTATNCADQKQFTAEEDRKDKHILEQFMGYIQQFDPDIIVGYGVNSQHWSYLTERCKRSGLHLYVDRARTEPHTSVYSHVSLAGRANLDLGDYIEEFHEIKVKTLENFADFLGVMKIEDRTIIEDIDIADYWDDRTKRETLKKYSMDNTRCIMGITEAVLAFATQLSNLVGLPLDHVGTAAAGFLVEWFLIKQTQENRTIIPPVRRWPSPPTHTRASQQHRRIRLQKHVPKPHDHLQPIPRHLHITQRPNTVWRSVRGSRSRPQVP
jgi:DNA polymerase I